WIILLVFWGGIWDYYHVFLALIGATAGPIVALILVDFFLVRKSKVSMKDLYQVDGRNGYKYTKGINIPAVVSFIIGILGYLYVYEPIEGAPRSEIFMYTTGTGFGMLVSGLCYFLLSLIKPINNYLRKDKHSESETESESAFKAN
ncbi:MAG TPA: cytosine permease, partial [Pseudogracilibacillus sp.]|nr:cytosine permease [Pseudogracilibacillus sp.]